MFFTEGYSVFARYYDQLTANIDYPARAEYFNEIITRFKQTDGNILLDLACGTGNICEEMARRGFDVIGVDLSQEMLGIALDKKFNSGLNIQYLCQDMRSIDMFGTVDVTLCALDSINHLDSADDVRRVFERVHLFTEPNGLFIFDVNSIYKHRQILADNTFTYETDSVYCIWENSLDAATDAVDMSLVFFELEENGLYSRSSDRFTEMAYPCELIEALLKECGFEILGKYGGDTFEPPHDTDERIVYAVRAIK